VPLGQTRCRRSSVVAISIFVVAEARRNLAKLPDRNDKDAFTRAAEFDLADYIRRIAKGEGRVRCVKWGS
jgi:hypothetical protein